MVEHVNGVGDYLEELKKHTFEKYDAFTVGEVFNMKGDELREFIGENGHFSSIFDFSAACLSDGKHGWYDSPSIEFKKWRETIIDYLLEIRTMVLNLILSKTMMSRAVYHAFCLNMPARHQVLKCLEQ